MDAVAQLCSDLVFTTNAPPRLVNVVHPDPVTWRHVFEAINSSLDADLPFVPMAQWLGKLEALAGDLGSQKHLDKVVRNDFWAISSFTDLGLARSESARILPRHGHHRPSDLARGSRGRWPATIRDFGPATV